MCCCCRSVGAVNAGFVDADTVLFCSAAACHLNRSAVAVGIFLKMLLL